MGKPTNKQLTDALEALVERALDFGIDSSDDALQKAGTLVGKMDNYNDIELRVSLDVSAPMGTDVLHCDKYQITVVGNNGVEVNSAQIEYVDWQ